MHHDFIFTTPLNLISIILSVFFISFRDFKFEQIEVYSVNFFCQITLFSLPQFHRFFSIFHLFKIDFHFKEIK